jgi:tyrosine-protein kinase
MEAPDGVQNRPEGDDLTATLRPQGPPLRAAPTTPMSRENTQDQILRDVMRLLRRQRIVVLVAILVATGVGIAYSVFKTPVYESSTELQFSDVNAALNRSGIGVPTPPDPTKFIAAAAEIIDSPEVATRVTKALDGDASREEVEDAPTWTLDPLSNLVTLTARADSAELAARLANQYAKQTGLVATRVYRAQLRAQAAGIREAIENAPRGTDQSYNESQAGTLESLVASYIPMQVVTPAEEPAEATSPKPLRDTFLAAFLGLIVGILAAFLRDSLDRRLTDAHDIQHQMHIPMVGYLEEDALGGTGFSRNGAGGGLEPGLEPFRILRSNVEFLNPERPPQVVAVTSPMAEEGKSTVAVGLAAASALAGKKVFLIECDLRRPVLAGRLKLSPQPGLSDWLAGSVEPADVIQQTAVERLGGQPAETAGAVDAVATHGALVTVVAGSWSSRPAEQLGSERFRELLSKVRKIYDLIILDCAPLLPVGDALELLPLVDGVLICVRINQTTREQALAAKVALERLPSRPTGLVVTGVRPSRDGYYYGYYEARGGQGVFASAGSPDVP